MTQEEPGGRPDAADRAQHVEHGWPAAGEPEIV